MALSTSTSFCRIIVSPSGIISVSYSHLDVYKRQEYVKTNGRALEVLTVALPDCYVEHGNVEVLKKELHVDAESVAKRIIAAL